MKLKDKLHFIPNVLSISRLVLTVIVIVLMFVRSKEVYSFNFLNLKTSIDQTFLAAGVFFTVACFTDFLDGFLARKYNWVSDFGKIWDSISDKVLTSLVYIGLAVLQMIPFYFVLIMIFRDFVIDGYRMASSKKGIIVPANIFGKIKAVLQMISIIIIFFAFNFDGSYDSTNIEYYFIQNLFVILSTLSSVISGVIYVVRIERQMKEIKLTNQIKQ